MASEASRVLKLIIMGVDEYSPTLNRLNGSLTNTGRTVNNQMGGMTRSTGLLSEQFRILRRTAEYAVAGFGIYKVIQAISAYKQFRTELGLLNANLQTTSRNLDQIGKTAINVSVKTATPLNDVLETYQNLASTFPNIRRSTLPVFATVESKASRILQVQPQDIGATIGGLATTFYGRNALQGPKGPGIITQIADMLVKTRFSNPNLTGQDITSYIPPLGGFASAAQFTLPQTLALYSGVQRQLINPATSAQYLRQLMIRIRKPTPGASKFFDQAKLGPTQLSNLSGMEILDRLIQHGLSLPGASMNFEQAKKAGFKGVSVKGDAATFFKNTVGGRQQSLVAITGIVRNFGQVVMQQQSLMDRSTGALDERWRKWLDQNRMTQAAIAFNGMTVSMLDDLNPLIQGVSQVAADIANLGITGNTELRKLAGGIGKVESHIPGVGSNASRYHLGGVTEIIGAALAIYGLKKSGAFGALSTGASKIPGFSRLFNRAGGEQSLFESKVGNAIRGPLDIKALSSALTGQANGTPGAPFWVVIHPLSAMTVPGMFGGKNSRTPTGPTSTEAKVWQHFKKFGTVEAGVGLAAKKVATKTGLSRAAAKLGPRLLPFAESDFLKGLGPAGALYSFLTDPGNINTGVAPSKGNMVGVGIGDFGRRVRKGSIADVIFNRRGVHGFKQQGLLEHIAQEPFSQKALLQFTTHQISEKTLEKLILAGAAPELLAQAHRSKATSGVIGNADILATFLLQPTEELKNLLKPQKVRAHVPTKLHGVGSPAPTSRGQSTKRNT